MNDNDDAVAIIGNSMCFPGAINLDEYWHILSNGIETIQTFTEEEMLNAGVKPERLNESNYIRAKGIIDEAEYFDAELFGIDPDRATLMDPQHRVFIQKCWSALDDAGYDPERFDGSIGLFGGCAINTYLLNNLRHADRALTRKFHQIEFLIMTDKDFLTTQTSYLLGLSGPSVTIQTACSTALVSIHYACESILSGECDIALAGAATVYAPQIKGYLYEEGSIVSNDGHVRSFDANGKGTVYSSGAAVIALKSLSNAIQDNDNIISVIKSTAINNDGMRKGRFRMPSAEGISEVATQALNMAGVESDQVGMIEANGSATPLGDPLEVEALNRAYGESDLPTGSIPIGSVKSNLGHMNVTAGMGAVLKTVLAVSHGKIPPSLFYETPNPQIDFNDTPFRVATKLEDWPLDEVPRIAGVNVYGVGGTNAHAIIEQAPALEAREKNQITKHFLILSADSIASLERSKIALSEKILSDPLVDLGDVSFTLMEGRRRMKYRSYTIASDNQITNSSLVWSENSKLIERERDCCLYLDLNTIDSNVCKHLASPTGPAAVHIGHALGCAPELSVRLANEANLYDEDKATVEATCAYSVLKVSMSYGVSIGQVVATGRSAVISIALACNWDLEDAFDLCRVSSKDGLEIFQNLATKLAENSIKEPPKYMVLDPLGEQLLSLQGEINYKALYELSTNSPTHLTNKPKFETDLTVVGISTNSSQPETLYSTVFTLDTLADHSMILQKMGDLWKQGVGLNWSSIYGDRQMRRVSLPAYSFEKTRHWVDIPAQSKTSNYDVAL